MVGSYWFNNQFGDVIIASPQARQISLQLPFQKLGWNGGRRACCMESSSINTVTERETTTLRSTRTGNATRLTLIIELWGKKPISALEVPIQLCPILGNCLENLLQFSWQGFTEEVCYCLFPRNVRKGLVQSHPVALCLRWS